MNEAKNAIDLIENAPDKVAKTFISSLLASKAITRINKRKFSEINTKDFPHILKVFNIWFFLIKVPMYPS